MRERIAAIMQARMGAVRLPGKTLMPLGGKTVLGWTVDRARGAKLVDEFVLATTTNKEDDVLEKFAAARQLSFFRGSEADVLDRYYRAAQHFGADAVVRISGDNPMVDSELVDMVVKSYREGDGGYVAVLPGKGSDLPMGFAVEVFSFEALEAAWREDDDIPGREDVTPFIQKNPERFAVRYLDPGTAPSPVGLTVDTSEGFEITRKVFESFEDGYFPWREAICAARREMG